MSHITNASLVLSSDEVPGLSQIVRLQYRSEGKIKTLRTLPHIAREWEAIGRELGVDDAYLKTQSTHDDSIIAALNVVRYWIKHDKKPTWRQLIRAMKVDGKLVTEASELEYALYNKMTKILL